MTTDAIRDTIAMAKQYEQQNGNLSLLLSHYVQNSIHANIQLSEQDATASLVKFVTTYISQVPDLLDAAGSVAREAGIEVCIQPFITLAADYFIKPEEVVCGHISLVELIDEAYLSHRLIEEMNDRFMAQAALPLVPIDMTMANLIIHNIIGEPFANELDEAVHFTLERTRVKEQAYSSEKFKAYIACPGNRPQHHQGDWPCLTEQLPVKLRFAL